MLDLTTAFATFPMLETERLLLRAVTFDDAADIFHILSNSLCNEAMLHCSVDIP